LARCAPPAGDEAEALLSPLELEADAAAAGADELLSFIELGADAEAEAPLSPIELGADAEAEALLSPIELGADADADALLLLSFIELGAGAEADALAPIEPEAGGAEADASAPIELDELCARTLDIGKPMRAASAPAANALLVSVISLFTSLCYVHREFGGEIGCGSDRARALPMRKSA
jgi:hypothetical protein